ncbi:TRAP transporter small permease [Ostreibacterium oceani]|uniref:TRAP transporter small permease protein n=1 Tax=Ostreibacterium oceani TaxID=2654998 RepID=A0A6N7ET47_9GAMM|nr:TRAP transporter small permease [Ostreibacterium oceani]MPV86014.1 TRAP transporter small permease subunit [Ostreibacterium oceani]
MSNLESSPHQSSLPGVLGTLDRFVSRIESFMLASGVLIMAIATIANVIGRMTFGSIFFIEELNRILIIFITFSGLSYAARHGRHIRMTAFFDMLGHKPRKILMIIIALVTAVCMLALSYYAFSYIAGMMKKGRILPALQIPVWFIYVWVPIGFFMTGVQYLLTAIKNYLADDIYLSTQVVDGYQESEIEI